MSDQRPRVIFCTTTATIVDFVRQGAGETDEAAILRLRPQYGTALSALPADEAQNRYEARFKTLVEEISAEAFDDGLNVLPPFAWIHRSGGQSFKISERIAGCVTAIYVELGGRYFRFNDDIRTPHEECLKRVSAFLSEQTAAPILATEGER